MSELSRLLRSELPRLSAEDTLLSHALLDTLRRDGWSDIEWWGGGLRAQGSVRCRIFGVLHLKHQKEPARRALVRIAVLRLLEEQAQQKFGDELCLVTDALLDSDSEALLSAAGIDMWFLNVARPPVKRVIVGPKQAGRTTKGPRAPWTIDGELRGADSRARGAIGSGSKLVRVRLQLRGVGEISLPGTTTVIARNARYQNGILIVPTSVPMGQEVLVDFFCLNHDAKPSDNRAVYDVGPLVKDPSLLRLAALLENKIVWQPEDRELVQTAVWEVSDKKRLSSETYASLQKLTDR